MKLSSLTWGEDGATIYATIDGVERRIASVPLPHRLPREEAKRLRVEIASVLASPLELLGAARAHTDLCSAASCDLCRLVQVLDL